MKTYRIMHASNCQRQAGSSLVCVRIVDEHSPQTVLEFKHAVSSVIELRLLEIACEDAVWGQIARSRNVAPQTLSSQRMVNSSRRIHRYSSKLWAW